MVVARSRWRDPGFLVCAVAALVIGVAIGQRIAYYQSIGGESVMSVAFFLVLTVLGVIVAAVVWPIVARLLRRSSSRAFASVGMASLVLAAGIGGGIATAGFTGSTYHPPVTLASTASISANLTGAGLASATVSGAAGSCSSEPNTRRVGTVEAFDLGAFGSGRLRGFLSFGTDGGVDGWAMIDGSDADPELLPIRWAGTLRVVSISPDRSSGEVSLDDVPLSVDAKLPGQSVGPEWPRMMSGDVSWQCQPFTE